MTARNPLKNLREEATCSVCLDFFLEPIMLLPCSHNFCRRCLDCCPTDAATGTGSCPQCRSPFPRDGFRPNRHLANMVEAIKELTGMEELCRRPLGLLCGQDGTFLCASCAKGRSRSLVPPKEAVSESRLLRSSSEDSANPFQLGYADPGDSPGSSPVNRWEVMRREVEEAGNLEMLAAFPPARGPPRTDLPNSLFEKLLDAVRDHGLKAPYTCNLLQLAFRNTVLTPHNFTTLCSLILTDLQFALWKLNWRSLSEAQADKNLAWGQHDPLHVVDTNMLLGEGDFATPAQQVRIPLRALEQVKNLALEALRMVPEDGKPKQVFDSIRQGPREPFEEFVERLKDALEKQVGNKEAEALLLKVCAIKNANFSCQKLLRPLEDPSVEDMVNACQAVGTYQASAAAAAVAAIGLSFQQCFSCGQFGHIRKQCPKSRGPGAKAPGTCPRCQKGHHFASQCWSKFDKNGQLLVGEPLRTTARAQATSVPQLAPSSGMQGGVEAQGWAWLLRQME